MVASDLTVFKLHSSPALSGITGGVYTGMSFFPKSSYFTKSVCMCICASVTCIVEIEQDLSGVEDLGQAEPAVLWDSGDVYDGYSGLATSDPLKTREDLLLGRLACLRNEM